jgi:hypothetical protein
MYFVKKINPTKNAFSRCNGLKIQKEKEINSNNYFFIAKNSEIK